VGGEVTQDGDFLLFEGNRYDRRGFLYKNFVMSAIVSHCVELHLLQHWSGWLSSRVISVLDLGAERTGFKSQPRLCR